MNLNHLAIFQAVGRAGSVSAGARTLHISQSAVSKQLTEFERTLGVHLFLRMPRGMRLTEAGRLLLGYANRLFAIELEAEQALRDLHQLGRGRIAIGASRTIGAYLLPRVLAAFRREHPAIELSLQVDNTQTIEDKLIAGEIDIGFSEGIIRSDMLDYRVFAQDELVLIAAPHHPAARQPATLAQLAKLPLLMHEAGSGTRAVTQRALAEKGLDVRPSMTLASTEALKHTVTTGVGLAILSALAVQTELLAKTLVMVPVKGLKIRRPLYRVQPKNVAPSPSLAAFLPFLQHATAGTV
jgi:DNA-binding transcriptional LysR family regulator